MTIVVGYVRTPQGEAALSAAVEQLRHGERLVVVNKPEPGELDGEFSAEQDSDALRSNLGELGVNSEVVNLYADDVPATLIVEQATIHAARLVVIGLRRRSPVGKILLGSTAVSVLFHAPCPVLSVRSVEE